MKYVSPQELYVYMPIHHYVGCSLASIFCTGNNTSAVLLSNISKSGEVTFRLFQVRLNWGNGMKQSRHTRVQLLECFQAKLVLLLNLAIQYIGPQSNLLSSNDLGTTMDKAFVLKNQHPPRNRFYIIELRPIASRMGEKSCCTTFQVVRGPQVYLKRQEGTLLRFMRADIQCREASIKMC